LWVLPAIPFFLAVLLVVGLLLHVTALVTGYSGSELEGLELKEIATTWVISVLIGTVALGSLLCLRITHSITFTQPGIPLAITLAVLDIAIPVGILLVLFYLIRKMGTVGI
jgi:hypothetical protein